jgi:hypothetical protein
MQIHLGSWCVFEQSRLALFIDYDRWSPGFVRSMYKSNLVHIKGSLSNET